MSGLERIDELMNRLSTKKTAEASPPTPAVQPPMAASHTLPPPVSPQTPPAGQAYQPHQPFSPPGPAPTPVTPSAPQTQMPPSPVSLIVQETLRLQQQFQAEQLRQQQLHQMQLQQQYLVQQQQLEMQRQMEFQRQQEYLRQVAESRSMSASTSNLPSEVRRSSRLPSEAEVLKPKKIEPCLLWHGCTDIREEHRRDFMHPCENGEDCELVTSDAHRRCFLHPCSGASNPRHSDRDERHMAEHMHLCPENDKCKYLPKDSSEKDKIAHAVRVFHVCRRWPCTHRDPHGLVDETSPLHVMHMSYCIHDPLSREGQVAHAAKLAQLLPTCEGGSNCHFKSDTKHAKIKSHPCTNSPSCALMSARDLYHARHFVHSNQDEYALPPGVRSELEAKSRQKDRYKHAMTDATLAPLCTDPVACAQKEDPVHCKQARHLCPAGALCTKALLDGVHQDEYLHFCNQGVQCKSLSDPAHRARFLHLCSQHDHCGRMGSRPHDDEVIHPCPQRGTCTNQTPQHRLLYRHPCDHDAECAKLNDGVHLLLHTHNCRHGTECQKIRPAPATAAAAAAAGADDMAVDVSHMLLFVHPCREGPACMRNDPLHRVTFVHTMLGLTELTAAERAQLQHCVLDFTHSPEHPVLFTMPGDTTPFTHKGFLCGFEVKGPADRSGKLVVWDPSTKKQIALATTEIQDEYAGQADAKSKLHPPWFRDTIRLFRLPQKAQDTVDAVLNKTIEGTSNLTFQRVFDDMFTAGITAFVVGGAVRDSVLGAATINDIDMSYDCDARELNKFFAQYKEPHGWRDWTGLVWLGDNNKQLYLEGKCFNGFNHDMLHSDAYPYRCSNADVVMELLCRDFACNALFYCPKNKVVLDICGYGISDACNKILRIPVAKTEWEAWCDGNPTKLIRYWLFRARGYTAASTEMQDFMKKKALDWFCCPDDAASQATHRAQHHPHVGCFMTKSKLQGLVSHMVGKKGPQMVQKFKDLLAQDIGQALVTSILG